MALSSFVQPGKYAERNASGVETVYTASSVVAHVEPALDESPRLQRFKG